MKHYFLYFLLISQFFSLSSKAEIVLPSIISDNMVLQQKTEVNLWGKANVGESIKVTTSWGVTIETKANNEGKWQVVLKTPKALTNQTIRFEGENMLEVKNVLIGEVWLCSGQSNMEFAVGNVNRWKNGVVNYEKELVQASYPEIRLFNVEQNMSPEKALDDCAGHWEVCSPETVEAFSAVGYFFGRKLYQELHTPIGLVASSYGGTHAESWTKMEVMLQDSVYNQLIQEFYASRDNYEEDVKQYTSQIEQYNAQVEGLAPDEVKKIKKPSKPKGINHKKALSTLWNAMINPIVNYSIKGVIWYQGESNSVRYDDYQHVFTNMIESWRNEWHQNLPFYFVQIAPHYKQPPQIREAQLNTWLSVENTGMVVITDAGDSTNIHPRNKLIPGERLADWALAKQYGKKIAYSGPVYKSMESKDGKAMLSFDYVTKGLSCPDDHVVGFTVAGNDGVFYPATAAIKGKKIELTSKDVDQIKYVRYGWEKYGKTNLYNGAGLPASPFRTDANH